MCFPPLVSPRSALPLFVSLLFCLLRFLFHRFSVPHCVSSGRRVPVCCFWVVLFRSLVLFFLLPVLFPFALSPSPGLVLSSSGDCHLYLRVGFHLPLLFSWVALSVLPAFRIFLILFFSIGSLCCPFPRRYLQLVAVWIGSFPVYDFLPSAALSVFVSSSPPMIAGDECMAPFALAPSGWFLACLLCSPELSPLLYALCPDLFLRFYF